jgi:hypothetical protein
MNNQSFPTLDAFHIFCLLLLAVSFVIGILACRKGKRLSGIAECALSIIMPMQGYPQNISPSGYHASMLGSLGMQVRLGSVHAMNTLLALLALAALTVVNLYALTDRSPKRENP